jgi:hypothetical protein
VAEGLYILWCADCGYPVQFYRKVPKIYCAECRRLVKKARQAVRETRMDERKAGAKR